MDSEAKWTKGPWRKSDVFVMAGNDTLADCVAMCDVEGNITKEQEHANARLIAAAPDLYEALKGMLRATDHWNDWEPGATERQAAQVALAKAAAALKATGAQT